MIKILKNIIPNYIKLRIRKTYYYLNFICDFLDFKNKSRNNRRFSLAWHNRYPILFDKTTTTPFDHHYTYHPAWAARIIAKTNPKKHVDISSVISFSTIVSAFLPVEFYDYRPVKINLSNLKSKEADLTRLPFATNSIESLSCMHTVEHIGLGRYGDPINPDGDIKAMQELSRVLTTNGNLLFVTPIGKPNIQFNAHRIYSYDQITSYFPDLKLKEFSLIPDDFSKGIIENASSELSNKQRYGCGLFWFVKK
ncbi:DUF268 domain-containing protein [Candidatus Nomurabacteria bacterium]|nr:DUF268 domain-containing protein [Candidatus Nomurabacteria bacterium]